MSFWVFVRELVRVRLWRFYAWTNAAMAIGILSGLNTYIHYETRWWLGELGLFLTMNSLVTIGITRFAWGHWRYRVEGVITHAKEED
jgi:membrane protein YdbS with pleckstrin-like domain